MKWIFIKVVCCVLFLSGGGFSAGEDYEEGLHEIYTKFYSQRISREEWQNLTQNQASDTYTIQKNDTLWDLSKTFFGDPNFWPKLWSVNSSITNPHLIRPDESIGFIMGTEAHPPDFKFIQGGVGSASSTKTPPPPLPKNFHKMIKDIKVPPTKKIHPVLNQIPGSLPVIQLVSTKEKNYNLDINFKFADKKIPTKSFLPFYVSKSPVQADGQITQTKEYGKLSHFKGQKVILKMKTNVSEGQRLSVVRDMGKVSPSLLGIRGPFGYQIKVQGEVKIIKKLKNGFNLYEAEITHSLQPVTVGAFVLSREMQMMDFKHTQNFGQTEAQITGFADGTMKTKNRWKGGFPFSIAYLNRGSDSGLSVGQMYQVKANMSVRKHDTFAYDIPVGKVKIVYTEDKFATALVMDMIHPIKPGDYLAPLGEAEPIALHEDESEVMEEDNTQQEEEDASSDFAEEEEEELLDEEDLMDEEDLLLAEEEDAEELPEETTKEMNTEEMNEEDSASDFAEEEELMDEEDLLLAEEEDAEELPEETTEDLNTEEMNEEEFFTSEEENTEEAEESRTPASLSPTSPKNKKPPSPKKKKKKPEPSLEEEFNQL